MARVVDFGIAKAGGNIHITRENAVKGKLGYMAPEQMNQGDLTRQADVYAAAVVLWEALTGKRLFDGESEAIVLSRVLNAKINPPSSIAKDVPPELDAIVLKALSRDVDVRHRSAKELANALEKIGPKGEEVILAVQEPLTEEVMQELNSRASIDKEEPEAVAAAYLKESGFTE
jgi:serine/threonine-protein kinase